MSARTEAARHRAEARAAAALLRAAEAYGRLANALRDDGVTINLDHDVVVTGARCADLGGYLDQRVAGRSQPQ